MKNIVIQAFCITSILIVTFCYADFNRTSRFIDIPTASILSHLDFRAGFDGSMALGKGVENEDADVNFHSAIGLGDHFEIYFDIYSIDNFTSAIGFCHRFYDRENIKLAWGMHSISYALDVSEIGHGDSTGWYDDLTYYRGDYDKPFELGSAFLVSMYQLNKNFDVVFGIGRGRYVGYGTHSKYFNSNFYHDQGGDWAIGLFAGMKLKIASGIAFMLEGDSRDLNFGFSYGFQPIEIALGVSKFEYWLWPGGGNYQPKLSASLSYFKKSKQLKMPKYGAIAGIVLDTDNRPVVAEIAFLDETMPVATTLTGNGNFRFSEVAPGMYELLACAVGYKEAKKQVFVLNGKTTVCDFTLVKEEPITGYIAGKVIDMKTNEPLVVHLSAMETDKTTTSDEKGTFEIEDLAPRIYDIKAVALDYETGFYPVVVKANERSDIVIKMVRRGMVITLKGVKFELNKSTLKPESYSTLDEAAAILTNHPDILVEIQGHTCSLGSDSYNLKLSNERASAVRDYLIVKHMIEPTRLTAHGYGESNPIGDNKSEVGRQQNRRVDFVILK